MACAGAAAGGGGSGIGPGTRRARQAGVEGRALRDARPLPGGGDAQRPVPGARLRGAARGAAPLGQDQRDLLPQGEPHRLLPVGRVPARAAPGQQPAQPRRRGRGAAGDVASSGSTSTRSSTRRRSRAWATAASAGSPPATSTRWRRSQIPAIGYGIRYEFGIFDQEIRDGWQVEMTDKWLRSATPGRSRGPRSPSRSRLGGRTETLRRTSTAATACAGCPSAWCRASPTTRPSSATASAPSTCCGCGRPRPPSRSTSRPSTWATTAAPSTQKVASENITKVLYPNDEQHAGQAAAARAAVLLRLLLAAGHDPDPPADGRAARRASTRSTPSQLNDTHPAIAVAELMRLLVDEHGMDWDAAWDDHAAHLRLHQPHAAARGAREVAGRAVRRGCCRGTWRSSTRSTAASSTRCATRYPGDERARGAAVADRRERRRARCAWPTWRASAATRINGVAALHTELLKRDVLRDFHELWPEKFVQRHQRRHAAALPGARQPAAGAPDHRRDRRRLARATSSGCASSSRSPRTRRSGREWREVKRANKARPRAP